MNVLDRFKNAKKRVLKDSPAGSSSSASPGRTFSRILQARARQELSPEAYAEVTRIVSMPIVFGYSPEEREHFQRERVIAQAYEERFRLHDEQCDAVMAFEDHGGLFAPIGVGHGKTLITLMIAGAAFKAGVPTTLLLVPPQVYSQLVTVDLPWARRRVVLYGCPFHGMHLAAKERRKLARSRRRGCYVLPYSMLSTKDSEELLGEIDPTVVIGDECHNLRHENTARTRRMNAFLNSRRPKVAWLSGTITSKSVFDYIHLARCLGEFSPLPIPKSVAIEWAATLDSSSETAQRATGPIYPLIEWARKIDVENQIRYPQTTSGFRRAYALRLRANPCVVSTGDKEVGTSLIVNFLQAPVEEEDEESFEELTILTSKVDDDWLTPTGDEIDFGMHKWKWLLELSAGFYNELYWPTPEQLVQRHGWAFDRAVELLEVAKVHHGHNQEYLKELRQWLERHHKKGLDTPLLVAASFKRAGAKEVGDAGLFELWKEQHDIREAYPDMPERWSRVVRVCPYKINAAVQWAAQAGDGILWYWHNGIGDWLHEALPDAIYAPAGSNDEILQSKGRLVIASVNAHGTGKNLQFHQNQLFVQTPRSAQLFEQSVGRTHRFGQQADELIVDALINQTAGSGSKPSFDELAFAAMLNDAVYIAQSIATPQKAIYATYATMPKVYPSEFLHERGLEPRVLSAQDQRFLLERFGADAEAQRQGEVQVVGAGV